MISKITRRTVSWLKRYTKILIPLILIAALFVLGRVLDLNQYLNRIQGWIWQFGSWGPIVFVAIYVGATLFLLPGTPFTLLAAFLFGNLWGFLTMMAATISAATLAFLMARYLARDIAARQLNQVRTINRFKRLIEDNHWFAIPFIRLMPIFPFAINNYALGLTNISFIRYFLLSLIVFIPMNAAIVFGANSLYAVLTGGEVSWLILGGATAAAFLILGLGFAGKRFFAQSPGQAPMDTR